MERVISESQSTSESTPPPLSGSESVVTDQGEYGCKSLAIDLKSISILQTLVECLQHGEIYSVHLGEYKDEVDTALPSKNLNYCNRSCLEW